MHTAVTVHDVGHISDVIFFPPDIILQVQFGQHAQKHTYLLYKAVFSCMTITLTYCPKILKQTFVMSVC